MKRTQAKLYSILVLVVCIFVTACGVRQDTSVSASITSSNSFFETITQATEEHLIEVQIGDRTLTAKLENNSSADAFYEKLKEDSRTIDMSDYGNFEKVGGLGFSLPKNDTNITTKAGDIILYQGNALVFYYDTNTWNFTKLGEFQNVTADELRNTFGDGDMTAVISVNADNSDAGDDNSAEKNPLTLSEMVVEITSDDKAATFQLYDTKAAAEFYNQLPLTLDLSNFRNAQWMFYPPEKLSVTEEESYHDGKKGELSYYEPWGDVVMFYDDFGSYSGLYELGQIVSGKEYISSVSDDITISKVVKKR